KAFAIEGGIVRGACASAVGGKCRLVRVHKGHALGRRIAAALAVFAARERLNPGQKSLRHEFDRLTKPPAIHREGRMHVEAVSSARTRRVWTSERRTVITDVHHS